MRKKQLKQFTHSGRPFGLFLSASGMFIVSTDSLFTRIAEIDGWTIAFFVGVFSIPSISIIIWKTLGKTVVTEITAYKWPLLLSSALAAIGTTAFIQAVTRTAVANVVTIVAGAPIFAGLIAKFAIGEKTSGRIWKAISGTFIGILIIVSGSLTTGGLDGDLMALLAILVFSTNLVIWRHFKEMSRTLVVLIAPFFIMLFTFIPAQFDTLDKRALLCTLGMGLFVGPSARLWMVSATRHASAAEVSMFTPVETIFASLWVWIWFDEVPEMTTFIGGLLVLSSVFYGIRSSK